MCLCVPTVFVPMVVPDRDILSAIQTDISGRGKQWWRWWSDYRHFVRPLVYTNVESIELK